MKRVVITGATGFIGSWLVEEMVKNNIDVTILLFGKIVNLTDETLKKIKTVNYNPNEIAKVATAFSGEYDAFYNVGWGGVSPEKKNDINIQLQNVKNSIDAVYFSKMINCKKFIGIGTVAEYVYCDIISPKVPSSPADIYGSAKVATHYMTKCVAENIGQEFIWTIVPSTFGERRTDNNLITYTIRTLLQRKRPSFTKLEQMWDFLYIADVVKALRLLGIKGKSGKMYGIGSGIYKPLVYYITKIRDIIDPNLELGIGDVPYKNGLISASCVDNTDLINDTDFIADYTFDDGIKKTIDYFKREM